MEEGNCSGFQNLRPEIISEILVRLPIEWIMICKSVCKTWYSLIKNNYFVKLQRSIAKDQLSSQVIFEPLGCLFDKNEANNLYLLDVQDCKIRKIPVFPRPDIHFNDDMNIMSSLDGLICLAPYRAQVPVLIVNPLLRCDYVILPETEILLNRRLSHHITLGFDPSINKYKAVRMLVYDDDFPYGRSFLCEVITIGVESSWRQVVSPHVGFFHKFYHGQGGVFHQGSIYWIINKFYDNVNGETRNNREHILEFDVSKEVFHVVSFPHSMREPKDRECRYNPTVLVMLLQSLGGYLALVEIDYKSLHIWRLVKQNGSTSVTGYRSITIESPYYKYVCIKLVLFPNGNDDFLFLQTTDCYTCQFCCYYPYSETEEDRFVNLSTLQFPSSHRIFYPWCFKPSLISIKAAWLSHS